MRPMCRNFFTVEKCFELCSLIQSKIKNYYFNNKAHYVKNEVLVKILSKKTDIPNVKNLQLGSTTKSAGYCKPNMVLKKMT